MIVKTAGGLIRVNKLPSSYRGSPLEKENTAGAASVYMSLCVTCNLGDSSMDRVPFGAYVSEGSNGSCFRGRARFTTDLGRKSQPDTLHLPNRRRQVWRQFLGTEVSSRDSSSSGHWGHGGDHFHLESSASHVNSLRDIKARVGDRKDASSIYLFIGESSREKEQIKKNNNNKVK